MKPIFLNIAGYFIEIEFKKETNFFSLIASQNISDSIKDFYSSYLCKPTKVVDFSIYFESANYLPLMKKGKFAYGFFFEEKAHNKITCNNSMNIFQFSRVLTYILLLQMSRGSGFMLHCSSLDVEGQAYLFVGKSGAGKTTAATLGRSEFPQLGDDGGIIKSDLNFFQLPFMETTAPFPRTNRQYPIGKILFIKKSKDFKIVKIKNKETVFREMSREIVCEKKDLQKYLKSVLRFVNEFDEFYYFYFYKNSKRMISFLKEIRNT